MLYDHFFMKKILLLLNREEDPAAVVGRDQFERNPFDDDYDAFSDRNEDEDEEMQEEHDSDAESEEEDEDKDKEYAVSKINTRDNISRIYFSFKIKGFATSGEEYVEIDSENNILTRRVTTFPKLNRPRLLIAITIISASTIASVILVEKLSITYDIKKA